MKNKKMTYFIVAIFLIVGMALIGYGTVETINKNNSKENDNIKNEETDNKKDNSESDKSDNETSNKDQYKGEQIDINDSTVTSAYNKILKTTNMQNSVYKKQKQTFETLDNQTAMLFVAEQIDDISLFEVEKNGKYSYMYSYKLNENVIKDYMKKIFGNVEFDYNKYNQEQGLLKETGDAGGPFFVHIEKTMVDKDNEILPGERMLACKRYQDGMYYFSEFNAGGMESNIQYTKLLNASIDGEYLYLYDEEFKVIYTNGEFVVYLDDETKDESIEIKGTYSIETPVEDIKTSIGDKIKTYEHTFKKDETGNYYWISTEQLKR